MDLDSLDKDLDQASNPFSKANPISKAFYLWVWPLLLKGRKKNLQQEDLFRVLEEDESTSLGDKLEKEWLKEVEKSKASSAAHSVNDVQEVKAFTEEASKSDSGGGANDDDEDDVYKAGLTKAATKTFWTEFVDLAAFLFTKELIRILQPVCLGYYMAWFGRQLPEMTRRDAWLAAMGIFMCNFVSVLCNHYCFFQSQRIGMRFRVAFSSLIYRKAVKLSQSAFETSTTGQMVNLLSNDVGRFDLAFIFIHYLWLSPLLLLVVLYLSYRIVGWVIFLGCVVLVSMIPFQIWMARKFSQFRLETAKKTDVRIRLMNEIISGIRVVKMYAWENSFAKLVNNARSAETAVTFKSCLFRTINLVVYYTTAETVLVIMLLPIVLSGISVTPEMVFLPLSWINAIKVSLALFFPNGVAFLSEARISVKRIQDFLLLDELAPHQEDENEKKAKNGGTFIKREGARNGFVVTAAAAGSDNKSTGKNTGSGSDSTGKDSERESKSVDLESGKESIKSPEGSETVKGKANEALKGDEGGNITEKGSGNASNDQKEKGGGTSNDQTHEEKPRLEFDHVVCHWSKAAMKDTLFDISLVADSPQVVAVVGAVGSGKSSLLQAVLGEIPRSSGRVKVAGKVSYTSQNAWVFSATLRENVLFGEPMETERYRQTLDVCCLEPDLEALGEDGDLTVIGDRGVSLSGGQKARISLARAVYRRADIYLLDDPLSAVDVHVGKQIFERCILDYLRDKIVVLATHQLHLLKEGISQMVVLDRGTVVETGTFADLSSNPDGTFHSLLQQQQTPDANEFAISNVMSASRPSSKSVSPVRDIILPAADATNKTDEPAHRFIQEESGESDPMLSKSNGKANGTAVVVVVANGKKDEGESRPPTTKAEVSQEGSVSFGVYAQYLLSGAHPVFLLAFGLLTLAMHGCNVFVYIWLSHWTGHHQAPSADSQLIANQTSAVPSADSQLIANMSSADHTNGDSSSSSGEELSDGRIDQTNTYYYGIFVAIVAGILILSSTNAVSFFTIAMRASRKLHNNMFFKVLRTRVRFFDVTPNGRIINRFSKDTGNMDELLPATLIDVFWIICSVISTIIVVSYGVPYMLLPAFFLALSFFGMRVFYMKTSRAIKRAEGVARSPIFSLVGTSLEGLAVLRAFRMQEKLARLFDRQQDVHTSAWFSFLAVGRWLGICSDLMVTFFLGFTVSIPLLIGEYTDAQVGMVVTASAMLTGSLQYALRQTAEAENLFTSVERILQYGALESEGQLQQQDESGSSNSGPEKDWIKEGRVEFDDVTMRYDDDSEDSNGNVLEGVTFSAEPGEKVGIVGRTGAGKSSLVSVLFRLVEPSRGDVRIDGQSVRKLGLHQLRKRVSIIPQDPLLFAGTLRANLDPFENHMDTDLWRALELAHLTDSRGGVTSLDMTSPAAASATKRRIGLETEVLEGGSNFSVGERQLICLARAILRNNKVLVLDEATANVDPRTDALIQETIRTQFKRCTVFTIAHRLNTIMDADKILVMGDGKVLEFGPPFQLLQSPDGALNQMIQHTAPETQRKLKQLAREAHNQRQQQQQQQQRKQQEQQQKQQEQKSEEEIDSPSKKQEQQQKQQEQ